MKLKIKHSILLLISIGWIILMCIRVYNPFSSIGKLFSYPEGLFNRDLPQAEIEFEDVGYNCEISFDKFGVPTISGDKSDDVAFGVGYMHARDRYFQMELITRTVQGNLSEIMGDLTINSDLFWKPMHCDSLAKKELEYLQKNDPEVYNYLQSYSDGIKFYLENEKQDEQFFEYILLDENPRMWEDHYPLLLSFYMSNMLAYDENKFDWASNLSNMSESDFNQFYKTLESDNYPYIFNDSVSFSNKIPKINISKENLVATIFNQKDFKKQLSIGSNNWVISNRKSSSNNSLLCNDTHLDIKLPNPWYQVHLICDEFHVQGFTIPCIPYVVSGNNDKIAWGITNANWDEVDLFQLKLSKDSLKYILDKKEYNFSLKRDVIKVKGEEDIIIETKYSIHGIVKNKNGVVFAEKWHALDFFGSSASFSAIMKSNDWDSFKNGLKKYTFPAQNFVFSDAKGNIGAISAGVLPYRFKDYRGELLDGSISHKFTYVPFNDLPQQYGNDSEFLYSANQLPAKSNYYINYSWAEQYRASRINTVLSQKTKLNFLEMKSLQTDQVDNSFFEIIKLYDSISFDNKQEKWFHELRKWDGNMNAESKVALKFHMLTLSFEHYFNEYFNGKKITRTPSMNHMINALRNESIKLNDKMVSTEKVKRSIVDYSIILYNQYVKGDMNYGNFSPFFLNHILGIPGLGDMVDGKGGNSNTVDVNGYSEHGASMRTIIELSENSTHIETILAGGQSGRVNSPDYRNQTRMWKEGEYNKIDFRINNKKKVNIRFKK